MRIKRTELTVESLEILIISKKGGLARSFCSDCDRQVAVISLNDAYTSGLSAASLHQQVKTNRLHLIETADGLSLICLNSLF